MKEIAMKRIVVFLAFILSALCHADDVYLKTGYVFRNVVVKDTIDSFVTLEAPNGNRKVAVDQISRVVKNEINPSEDARMEKYDELLAKIYIEDSKNRALEGKFKRDSLQQTYKQGRSIHYYEYPNLKIIPISIISFAFSWDYYATASISGEKEKTRRNAIATMFLAAGILNTVFAFEKVEVTIAPNQLSLNYNF